MSFHPKVTERINGWGQVFRFVTPLMVGLLLAQYNIGYQEQAKFREEMRTAIHSITQTVNHHLQQEVPVIRERISTIEARFNIKPESGGKR